MALTKSYVIFGMLLTSVLIGQAAYAERYVCNMVNKDYWQVDPSLLRMRLALQPWYQEVVQSIRADPEYEQLMQKMVNMSVDCTFVLKSTGELTEPKVRRSSGLKSLDQAALELVLKNAPLKTPPNSLPFQAGAQLDIFFTNSGSTPYLQVYVLEPEAHFHPPYTMLNVAGIIH